MYRTLIRVVATTAVAALALAGCTSSHPSKAAPSSSPAKSSPSGAAASAAASSDVAAAGAQLAKLVIKAKDIPTDKFTLTKSSSLGGGGAYGTSAIFANSNNNRVLSIILIHYPNADDAQAATPAEQTTAAGELTRNPVTDVPSSVGQLGQLYQGANATGPLSILVFAEGAYVVSMEFVSKTAGDSVPASVVTDVGKKQDALLKAK